MKAGYSAGKRQRAVATQLRFDFISSGRLHIAQKGQRTLISVSRESGRSRGYWQSLRGYRPVDAKVH